MSVVALIGGMFVVLLTFATSARADYTVSSCGSYPNDLFTLIRPADGAVTTTNSACPAGGPLLEVNSSEDIAGSLGSRGAWQATAPAGLEIVGASVPNGSLFAFVNGGWGGGPYWQGGGAAVTSTTQGGSWSGFASPFFGFQLVCEASQCPVPGGSAVDVMAVSLSVRETVSPSLSAPGGLWQAKGWVRGVWPLVFSGDSPSGVCALSGTLNGVAFTGSSAASQDLATWHQCSAPAVSTSINTAAYGQGAMPLVIAATDAAGVVGRDSETVDVDNSVPTVTLSGPADAPNTAGTQFVTATAGGSPSGIDQIVCSVDGGPSQAYPGAVARVPVSGLGLHQVSCTAYNNAVDANGVHGVSQTQRWSIKIGTPTALDVTFARFAGLRLQQGPCAPGQVRLEAQGQTARPAWARDESERLAGTRRRDCAGRQDRRGANRPRQRNGALHACGRGDHRRRRHLDRAPAGRSLTTDRSIVRRQRNHRAIRRPERSSSWSRPRSSSRPSPQTESPGARRSRSKAGCSAATCPRAASMSACGSASPTPRPPSA